MFKKGDGSRAVGILLSDRGVRSDRLSAISSSLLSGSIVAVIDGYTRCKKVSENEESAGGRRGPAGVYCRFSFSPENTLSLN